MRALMRDLIPPASKLRVEIVDVDKRAGGEEGVPEIRDLPLDLPLLVRAARRTRPRGKVIMPGELQEPRMKPNRGPGAFKDGAAEVVVDQGTGDALTRGEGLDVAAEKTLKRLIDGEEREDGAGVRQHHHKTGERAHTAADPDRAKGAPVDLGLFSRERDETPIDRRRGRRPNQPDGAPQLHDRAGVAAALHHREEPRRAQPGILRQRVAHEGEIPIELCGATRTATHTVRVIHNRGTHRVMVDAESRGDGADLPMFAVIEPANLGVLLGRDHGASSPGTRDGSARAVEGARRSPGRKPCNATRPPEARSAPDPSTCLSAV